MQKSNENAETSHCCSIFATQTGLIRFQLIECIGINFPQWPKELNLKHHFSLDSRTIAYKSSVPHWNQEDRQNGPVESSTRGNRGKLCPTQNLSQLVKLCSDTYVILFSEFLPLLFKILIDRKENGMGQGQHVARQSSEFCCEIRHNSNALFKEAASDALVSSLALWLIKTSSGCCLSSTCDDP